MNKRPEKPSLRGITNAISGGNSGSTRRRVSRHDQDARNQRIFIFSVVIAAVLVIGILGGGMAYEYLIKPNQVLAEVNGHQIKRRDYWKYQSVILYQQARLYENYAMLSTGTQQSQFLSYASALDAQREDVWGSTDVSATSLQSMIENQIYVDAAEEQGFTFSDDDMRLYALNTFSENGDIVTPIPTPTMIPERAEAATETAIAANGGTPIATVTPAATPATGDATAVASPNANATPATPEATADPIDVADAQLTNFENQVFDDAHMSTEDYYRLYIKPSMARDQIDAQLQNAVPQTAEQAHLRHILVATEELAQQLVEQANGGASFDALARANSTDTVTAATGGDLGWVTRDEVDPAVADAAFGLQPNQITAPIQTAYGWEIVQLVEHDADRPLSDTQYENARAKAVSDWLTQQRDAGNIKTDYDVTPTSTPATYVPPSGAPTPIPATPIPTAPPVLYGPTFVPAATPVPANATPAATPSVVIGPDATPATPSTPVSTPIATVTPVTPTVTPLATATPAA